MRKLIEKIQKMIWEADVPHPIIAEYIELHEKLQTRPYYIYFQ